jgi:hypothetical protein
VPKPDSLYGGVAASVMLIERLVETLHLFFYG